MKYKEGDVLKKNISGDTYTVSAIIGSLVAITDHLDDFDDLFGWYTESRLEKQYTLVSSPWEPKDGEELFFINSKGHVGSTTYINSKQSIDRIAFGNCFRTREDAEAALERVRAALKQV